MNEELGDDKAIVYTFMDGRELAELLRVAEREGYGNGEYVFVNVLPHGEPPYQFSKGVVEKRKERELCINPKEIVNHHYQIVYKQIRCSKDKGMGFA